MANNLINIIEASENNLKNINVTFYKGKFNWLKWFR